MVIFFVLSKNFVVVQLALKSVLTEIFFYRGGHATGERGLSNVKTFFLNRKTRTI
jgi:hypothetical protein